MEDSSIARGETPITQPPISSWRSPGRSCHEPSIPAGRPPTRLADLFGLVGTVLDGRYLIERAVGEGGFSVVYRAVHLGFNSLVAIKVLKLPSELSLARREAFVRNFVLEGRVLFELGAIHPSIASALEVGSTLAPDGSVAPYLAIEWLEGCTLDVELRARKGRLPSFDIREAMDLLAGPAGALAAAHARGIVHRDIKPGNIFLSKRGDRTYPKLVDFGLAKIVGDSPYLAPNLAETTGESRSFTPAYAAPEQWLRRLGATGPWTDVHGLALVLVELLTGRKPFAGHKGTEIMAACLDASSRPTPRALGCQLSRRVDTVMARALALDPGERYRTVDEFWTALQHALGRKSIDSSQSAILAEWRPRFRPDVEGSGIRPTRDQDAPNVFAVATTGERLGWRKACVRIVAPAFVVAALLGALLAGGRHSREAAAGPTPLRYGAWRTVPSACRPASPTMHGDSVRSVVWLPEPRRSSDVPSRSLPLSDAPIDEPLGRAVVAREKKIATRKGVAGAPKPVLVPLPTLSPTDLVNNEELQNRR